MHRRQEIGARPTSYAVVVMISASWHSHKTAIKFDNLSIMYLPLYSPALNPIEQESVNLIA
ncbi:MAG: transposase [Psychromonas sp.]|jgi:transposase